MYDSPSTASSGNRQEGGQKRGIAIDAGISVRDAFYDTHNPSFHNSCDTHAISEATNDSSGKGPLSSAQSSGSHEIAHSNESGGEEGQEKNEEENSLPQQQQLDSMFSQTAKMFALDVMWLLFLSVVACLFACGWIASSSSSRENHSFVKSNMPDPSEKHHYCGDVKVAMEVVVATKTFIVCDPEDVGKMFLCPKSWLSMLKSVFESKSFSQWRNEVCTEVHFPPGTNATGEEKTKRDERDDNTITRLHLGQLFDEWKAKRSAEKRDRMKTAICNDEITEGNEERADAQSGDYCYFYSPVEICKISITSIFLILFFLKLASFLYPELYITRREGGVPFFFQIDSEQ